ncbi:MAG: hypothetical protein ACR2FY_15700 [Pirellulaceae bacterium]
MRQLPAMLIEHQHAVGVSQVTRNLSRQFLSQRLVIPLRHADKPLQRHPVLAEAVGYRPRVPMFHVRQQPAHEGLGMTDLLHAPDC